MVSALQNFGSLCGIIAIALFALKAAENEGHRLLYRFGLIAAAFVLLSFAALLLAMHG